MHIDFCNWFRLLGDLSAFQLTLVRFLCCKHSEFYSFELLSLPVSSAEYRRLNDIDRRCCTRRNQCNTEMSCYRKSNAIGQMEAVSEMKRFKIQSSEIRFLISLFFAFCIWEIYVQHLCHSILFLFISFARLGHRENSDDNNKISISKGLSGLYSCWRINS